MSGFQYQCDTCSHVAVVDGLIVGDYLCPSCGVGRWRPVRAVDDDDQGKTFVPPGVEKKEGGRGPLDPTGPFSSARKDETLPTDISEGEEAGIAIDVIPIPDEAYRYDVGAEDDLGSNLTNSNIEGDELPISAYVTVQRREGVNRKMLRAWKRLGHAVVSIQCGFCRKTCVLAMSTLRVIDEAWEQGLRYEAICEVCAEEKGVREEDGGIVAAQAEELREVQRRKLEAEAKARAN